MNAFRLKYLQFGVLSVTTSFKMRSRLVAALLTSSSMSELAVTRDLKISLKLARETSRRDFMTLQRDSHAANRILESDSLRQVINGVIRSFNNCSEICSFIYFFTKRSFLEKIKEKHLMRWLKKLRKRLKVLLFQIGMGPRR